MNNPSYINDKEAIIPMGAIIREPVCIREPIIVSKPPVNPVDELAQLEKEINELTVRRDTIQAELLKRAEKDLAASKVRTIRYAGSNGYYAVATLSQNVKIVLESMLPDILGKAFPDLTSSKTTTQLTSVGKRILGSIYMHDFIRDDVDAVIAQITPDPDKRSLLKKKLKGANPKTDAKSITAITGRDDETAETYAFFVSEAIVWRDFQKIMKANGITDPDKQQEILELIDTVIAVEEIPKIQIVNTEDQA